MYVCLDCYDIFDEPERYVEKHGFTHGPYEEWYGCPGCGGAYAKAYECDGCGEWITDEYVMVDGQRFCKDCYRVVYPGDE